MWMYLVALAAGVWVVSKIAGRGRDPVPEQYRRPERYRRPFRPPARRSSEDEEEAYLKSSIWSDDECPFSEADMHRMSIEDDIDRGLAGPGEYAELAMLDEEDDYE